MQVIPMDDTPKPEETPQALAERMAPPCDSDLYRYYDADTGLIADCEYEPGYPGSDWEPPVKEEMLVHRVYANGLEVDHLISDAVTANLAAAAIVHIRASKVGENGIKAGVWYSLSQDGEFAEVQP